MTACTALGRLTLRPRAPTAMTDTSQMALALPTPTTWTRPKGKGKSTCGRDPAAGPGTCWHWWGGCPQAERRGCYQLWYHRQHETTANTGQS